MDYYGISWRGVSPRPYEGRELRRDAHRSDLARSTTWPGLPALREKAAQGY